MKNKPVTIKDLDAMFMKLSKAQTNDLSMSYIQGLRESVQKKDFKQMFLWASVAYVLNELYERNEDKENEQS